MKKILIGSLFFISLFLAPTFASAQLNDNIGDSSASDCLNLKNDLRYRATDAKTNGEVSLLQDFLQTKGFLTSEPTGFFGNLTRVAVRQYQATIGVNQTGGVGPLTRSIIRNTTCSTTVSSRGTIDTGNSSSTSVTRENPVNTQSSGFDYRPGNLELSQDLSAPSYEVVSANTQNRIVNNFRVSAKSEPITLSSMDLVLLSGNPQSLTSVSIWNGTSMVGSAVFIGHNSHATSTFLNPVTIPQNSSVTLTLKADLSEVGIGNAGISGDFIRIDAERVHGTGQRSGLMIDATYSGQRSMSGIRMFKSYPTVIKTSLPSSVLRNGQMSLLRFKVAASTQGAVNLAKLTLRIRANSTNVSSLNVYAYTDPSFTIPVSGLGYSGALMNNDFSRPNISGTEDIEIPVQTSAGQPSSLSIPAGRTLYFDVIGGIGGAFIGSSVVTTLVGDNAVPQISAISTFGAVNNDANNNFIWSPNTVTNSSLTDSDWTNGYGLVAFDSGASISDALSYDGTGTVVSSQPPVETSVKPTVNLKGSTARMTQGQSLTLTWSSTNAQRCYLDNGPSETKIGLSGNVVVSPAANTAYYIWCSSDNNTGSARTGLIGDATFGVIVDPVVVVPAPTSTPVATTTPTVTPTSTPSVPAALSFVINKNSAVTGDSVSLTWFSTNTSICIASGDWSGVKTVSGSASFVQNTVGKHTYTLVCSNPKSDATKSVSVDVSAPAPAVAVTPAPAPAPTPAPVVNPALPLSFDFNIDKTSVISGDTVILSWTSSNASTCTAGGEWSGAKTASGSEGKLQSVAGRHTYSLSCSNSASSATKSVNVDVVAPTPVPAPTPTPTPAALVPVLPTLPSISQFYASPATAALSKGFSLVWNSTDASSCSIQANTGATKFTVAGAANAVLSGQPASGSVTIPKLSNAVGDQTYTLTCSNSSGSATKNAIIKVTAAPVPVITFSTYNMIAGMAQVTVINWSSTNANRCVLKIGSGSVETLATTGSKTMSGMPAGMALNMTCYNDTAATSATKTVTVSSDVVAQNSEEVKLQNMASVINSLQTIIDGLKKSLNQ